MSLPGKLFRVALLMLSAPLLPAFEINITANLFESHAAVSGQFTGLGRDEIAKLLDSGSTIRLTWSFRKNGQVESVVYNAHRDSLGDGYIIFGLSPDEDPIPVEKADLMRHLSILEETVLSTLGPWDAEELLEGRLYLDRDLLVPPMSIRSLFGYKRDSSSWQPVRHPLAVSR